jgi:hypothetical protein
MKTMITTTTNMIFHMMCINRLNPIDIHMRRETKSQNIWSVFQKSTLQKRSFLPRKTWTWILDMGWTRLLCKFILMLIISVNKELHHLYLKLIWVKSWKLSRKILNVLKIIHCESKWKLLNKFNYHETLWWMEIFDYGLNGMLIYGFHSQMINGTTWTSISTFICFIINQNLSTNVIWFMSDATDMTLIFSSQLMPW